MSFQWMIDDSGRQARCSAGGTGLGAAVAMGAVEYCVSTYRDKGFVRLEDFDKKQPPRVEPVAQPAASSGPAPRLQVGDRWTDLVSGSAQGTLQRRVSGVEDQPGPHRYFVNEGQRTVVLNDELNPVDVRQGGSVTSSYEPALPHFFWPLEVGKQRDIRWSVDTANGPRKYVHRIEVKSYGRVHVPAGDFEAFYLLVTSPDALLPSIDQGPRVYEIWYAPGMRNDVKMVTYRSTGWLISELSEYVPGQAPSAQPVKAAD